MAAAAVVVVAAELTAASSNTCFFFLHVHPFFFLPNRFLFSFSPYLLFSLIRVSLILLSPSSLLRVCDSTVRGLL